jgi:hypothetical protein
VEENINFQLVPPGLHQRAIRTFKNHFIAGLCTTAPDFPLTLWDQLLPQALMTLNLLRTWHGPRFTEFLISTARPYHHLAAPAFLSMKSQRSAARGCYTPLMVGT